MHFLVNAYIPKHPTKLLLTTPTLDERIPHCAIWGIVTKISEFSSKVCKGEEPHKGFNWGVVCRAALVRQKRTQGRNEPDEALVNTTKTNNVC